MARNKTEYPSKKTLNLCVKEKKQINPWVAIPLCILVIALAAAFAKFAVIDRINAMNEAKRQIREAEDRIAQLQEKLTDYDDVALEYARYSVAWMSDSEKYLVPRTEMIELMNDELAKSATINRVTMSGNRLSVELGNTTLTETSSLVDRLRERKDVSSVAVYSAASDDGRTSVVSLVINMLYTKPATSGEGGAK